MISKSSRSVSNWFALFLLAGVTIIAACELPQEGDGGVSAPQIVVKALPADLAALSIRVSGPGMRDIVRELTPGGGAVTIAVPAGLARRFEISGYVGALGPVPAYVGGATVDLKPGDQQAVSIPMQFAAGKIYVPNFGSDSVTVIDGARSTVITTIGVGSGPSAVGVNSATRKVYVVNAVGGSVSVIDGDTDTVTGTIPIIDSNSSFPDTFTIGVNPITNRIYVGKCYGADTVAVINGATDSVITDVDTSSYDNYPFGVGVNPATNKIYVTLWGKVLIINGSTNGILGDVSGGSWNNLLGLAVNSDTNTVYAVHLGNDEVSVISGASDSVTMNIAVGASPYGAAVNANTNRIYVANKGDNTVSVINGATNSVATTIPVGTEPLGVAVNSYTNRVYVANSGGAGVSVIDGATNAVITTVSVGTSPAYPGILR